MSKVQDLRNLGAAHLAIVVFFALLYLLAGDDFDLGEDRVLNALYFSMTTSSTVGFGDISPRTRRGKLLVMTHQFIIMLEVSRLLLLNC